MVSEDTLRNSSRSATESRYDSLFSYSWRSIVRIGWAVGVRYAVLFRAVIGGLAPERVEVELAEATVFPIEVLLYVGAHVVLPD